MDTAASACSVAAWEDGNTLAWRQQSMARGQAEALLPMVRAVLIEAEVKAVEFDIVAATVGPGAFTGIRIGLSAARGIALSAGLPCVGVTNLEAIAAGALKGEHRSAAALVVAIDTKRGDIYAQGFDMDGGAHGQALACSYEFLASQTVKGPVMIAGDAAEPLAAAMAERGIEAFSIPTADFADPGIVAAIAARRWLSDEDSLPPEPFYLRAPLTSNSRPRQATT